MAGISLLWLLLPSVGLAAYVQYTASHYDKKIESIDNEIKGTPQHFIEHLPFNMYTLYINIVGHSAGLHVKYFDKQDGKNHDNYDEKDKTQSILRLIVWFIAIVVIFQFISLSFFDIFSLADNENPSAKWFVFFVLLFLVCSFLVLYVLSIKHIDTKKEKWIATMRLHNIIKEEVSK